MNSLRYVEILLLGGKKRKKLMFFAYFLIFFTIFVATIIAILSTITNFTSSALPTTTFYCLYTTSADVSADVKRYASRGAGAFVFDKDKIGLALFSSETDASSVKNSLTLDTPCEILPLKTPTLYSLDLTTPDSEWLVVSNETVCDTITSLCSLSIDYDTGSVTEAQVRSTILLHITRLEEILDSFLDLHPDYFSAALPSSLNTSHTMLTTSISWLRYVVTTSSYTDDLTNFAGVLRNTTLNLIFAISHL